MTLEELKEIIEKADETQHDNSLNCGVCKAAADYEAFKSNVNGG